MKTSNFCDRAALISLALLGSHCGAEAPFAGDSSQAASNAPEEKSAGRTPGENLGDQASLAAASQTLSTKDRFDLVSGIVGSKDLARQLLPSDDNMPLVFSLGLKTGETIMWLEPAPGRALVAVHGNIDSQLDIRAVGHGANTSSELFSLLSPNTAIPNELSALDKRTVQMAPVYEQLSAARNSYPELEMPALEQPEASVQARVAQPTDATQTSAFGEVTQALTANECLSNARSCNSNIPGGHAWIVVQKDRTSDAVISRSDAFNVWGIGCSQSGRVTYRMRYREWFTWGTWFTIDLNAGEWVGAWQFLLSSLNDHDLECKLMNFTSGAVATQCAEGQQ